MNYFKEFDIILAEEQEEIKFILKGVNFTWDSDKAKSNKQKHKISFELAAEACLDKNAHEEYDEQNFEYGEERIKLIGMPFSTNTILVVVFVEIKRTEKNKLIIRIISARKAIRKEREDYAR